MSSTIAEITEQIASGAIDAAEGQKLIAKLMPKGVYYKVAKKSGAISFYGIRKMPITLYKNEIESILEIIVANTTHTEEYEEFLKSNADSLSIKK